MARHQDGRHLKLCTLDGLGRSAFQMAGVSSPGGNQVIDILRSHLRGGAVSRSAFVAAVMPPVLSEGRRTADGAHHRTGDGQSDSDDTKDAVEQGGSERIEGSGHGSLRLVEWGGDWPERPGPTTR